MKIQGFIFKYPPNTIFVHYHSKIQLLSLVCLGSRVRLDESRDDNAVDDGETLEDVQRAVQVFQEFRTLSDTETSPFPGHEKSRDPSLPLPISTLSNQVPLSESDSELEDLDSGLKTTTESFISALKVTCQRKREAVKPLAAATATSAPTSQTQQQRTDVAGKKGKRVALVSTSRKSPLKNDCTAWESRFDAHCLDKYAIHDKAGVRGEARKAGMEKGETEKKRKMSGGSSASGGKKRRESGRGRNDLLRETGPPVKVSDAAMLDQGEIQLTFSPRKSQRLLSRTNSGTAVEPNSKSSASNPNPNPEVEDVSPSGDLKDETINEDDSSSDEYSSEEEDSDEEEEEDHQNDELSELDDLGEDEEQLRTETTEQDKHEPQREKEKEELKVTQSKRGVNIMAEENRKELQNKEDDKKAVADKDKKVAPQKVVAKIDKTAGEKLDKSKVEGKKDEKKKLVEKKDVRKTSAEKKDVQKTSAEKKDVQKMSAEKKHDTKVRGRKGETERVGDKCQPANPIGQNKSTRNKSNNNLVNQCLPQPVGMQKNATNKTEITELSRIKLTTKISPSSVADGCGLPKETELNPQIEKSLNNSESFPEDKNPREKVKRIDTSAIKE